MLNKSVKYIFNLGGMKHNVIIQEVPGFRWKNYPPKKEVHISPSYQGEQVRPEIMERNFWDAIFSYIHEKVMLRTKGILTQSKTAYSSLVTQFMSQIAERADYLLKSQVNFDNTYLQIGSGKVTIVIDNNYCEKERVYGRYDSNVETIHLQSEGVTGDAAILHHPEFMLQVLIHECLHAVANQLGLHETKWNTEHQINTLSFFLLEVLLSRKNVEEKGYKYTESPHGVLGLVETKLTADATNTEDTTTVQA